MRSVAEHQRAVTDLFAERAACLITRQVPLAEASGRVLADDLLAPGPLPAFANSSMDGYAVRAADVADASEAHPAVLPVTTDVPAGAANLVALEPGTAQRIMTGAPVPPGADAVVPVEATDRGRSRLGAASWRALNEHRHPATET